MNPFIDCSAVCCTELELELEKEHQEYEDLTAKYDLLEEDYVVIKAKLVMEKQDIEREFVTLKKEHETVEGELRTLRETFNVRQDTWIKEKLDMQERVKELEEKELRYAGDGWILERTRLKDIIEENRKYQSTRSTMTWPERSELLRRRGAVVVAVVAVVIVEPVRA